MTNNSDDTKNVLYIYDKNLCVQCDRLPTMLNRASMVHDLILSYGLLKHIAVGKSVQATEDDLKLCHSSAYIEFLKKVQDCDDIDELADEEDEFGLGYDCPILEDMYTFAQTIAGGSMTAAKALVNEQYQIAINWFGGWHHAQRDSAEGFCYINDAAIAIQKLREKFKRILYIDLDIHHGNGVQNLFETSQRILTLSFHKYEPGFYPGTGSLKDLGFSKGKYYSLNVPFSEGLSDSSLSYTFDKIFPRVFEIFRPSAIVVQCGADGIRGDPVGECNLTPRTIGECVKKVLSKNIPTLFLGGGGYNSPNAARHWAYLTSVIAGLEIPNDIPDCSEFFTHYGPDYELTISAGPAKDTNSKKYLDQVIETVLEQCNHINVEAISN